MKKIIISILIYSIISLILLTIISIPSKVDQEKIEANIQSTKNSMREIIEERWPDMPEEIKENSLKINENNIRSFYENSNTFSYKFISNLRAYLIGLPIGLPILIVAGILYEEHKRELYGE